MNVKEAGFLPNVSLNVAAIKPIVIAPMEGVETQQDGEGTADTVRVPFDLENDQQLTFTNEYVIRNQ